MTKRVIFVFVMIGFLLCAPVSYAQKVANDPQQEAIFLAATKQVNQFFRRFNGEEDFTGKFLYAEDQAYRSKKLRKQYLANLFNNESDQITFAEKELFIKDITERKGKFLDFYKSDWIAEVSSKFLYKGKSIDIILFLSIELENGGAKWVFQNVYFPAFESLFFADSTGQSKFIHPMSHELDFMNLQKIFRNNKYVEFYASEDFKPDHLTLFLYEMKRSKLKFQSVSKLKFHVFQIDNWYFELSEFNRNTTNSGWLVSNLLKMKEKQKEELMQLILN